MAVYVMAFSAALRSGVQEANGSDDQDGDKEEEDVDEEQAQSLLEEAKGADRGFDMDAFRKMAYHTKVRTLSCRWHTTLG